MGPVPSLPGQAGVNPSPADMAPVPGEFPLHRGDGKAFGGCGAAGLGPDTGASWLEWGEEAAESPQEAQQQRAASSSVS